MPGAGDYAPTRAVNDEDPTGYPSGGTKTKTTQSTDWRIRVNRYAKAGVTNA